MQPMQAAGLHHSRVWREEALKKKKLLHFETFFCENKHSLFFQLWVPLLVGCGGGVGQMLFVHFSSPRTSATLMLPVLLLSLLPSSRECVCACLCMCARACSWACHIKYTHKGHLFSCLHFLGLDCVIECPSQLIFLKIEP